MKIENKHTRVSSSRFLRRSSTCVRWSVSRLRNCNHFLTRSNCCCCLEEEKEGNDLDQNSISRSIKFIDKSTLFAYIHLSSSILPIQSTSIIKMLQSGFFPFPSSASWLYLPQIRIRREKERLLYLIHSIIVTLSLSLVRVFFLPCTCLLDIRK